MRKCLGKHSCMSSPFPIAILNGTSFFPTAQLHVHKRLSRRGSLLGWWLSNLLLLMLPFARQTDTLFRWIGCTIPATRKFTPTIEFTVRVGLSSSSAHMHYTSDVVPDTEDDLRSRPHYTPDVVPDTQDNLRSRPHYTHVVPDTEDDLRSTLHSGRRPGYWWRLTVTPALHYGRHPGYSKRLTVTLALHYARHPGYSKQLTVTVVKGC